MDPGKELSSMKDIRLIYFFYDAFSILSKMLRILINCSTHDVLGIKLKRIICGISK